MWRAIFHYSHGVKPTLYSPDVVSTQRSTGFRIPGILDRNVERMRKPFGEQFVLIINSTRTRAHTHIYIYTYTDTPMFIGNYKSYRKLMVLILPIYNEYLCKPRRLTKNTDTYSHNCRKVDRISVALYLICRYKILSIDYILYYIHILYRVHFNVPNSQNIGGIYILDSERNERLTFLQIFKV